MNVGILEAWLKLRDELTPALKSVAGTLEKTSTQLEKTARDILPVAAALGLAAGASIKFASDFDAALTESGAIMSNFSDSMKEDLGKTAREVALTTTQSAEEAAKGYYYLASAGIDTAEALKNALPVAAQFAQAGVMNMADATEILVDSVKSLGLSVDKDMTHVGDVIVKAAVASSASVQQLGDALTNKAAIAMRTFGISVEQGTAVLSVFADQGVKGQIAGERLSILINGMAEAFGKNSKAFKEYGIALYDNTGKMRNIADVAQDFERALKGLSDQQKNSVLDSLNLTRETKAAVLQLTGASTEVRRYQAAFEDAGGTMEKIAANQMKSFANQMDLMKKKIVDAGISLGNELIPIILRAVPIFEYLIDKVNSAIQYFGSLSDPVKLVVVAMGALIIALPPLLFGLGALASAGGVLLTGLGLLGAAISVVLTALSGLGVAALIAAGPIAGVAALLGTLASAASKTNSATEELEKSTGASQKQFESNIRAIREHTLSQIASEKAAKNLENATAKVGAAHVKTKEEMEAAEKAAKKLAETGAKNVEELEKFKALEIWDYIAEGTLETKRFADASDVWKKLQTDAAKVAPIITAVNAQIKATVENFIALKHAWDDDQWEKTHQMAPGLIEKARKATEDAKKETTDWAKVLTAVSEVFKILGVSAESNLGKTITALTGTLSIMKETQKLVGTDGDKGFANFLKLDSAKKGEVALQGLNAALVAYKSGVMGGIASGAAFGSSFGPWGIAIGGAIGGLLGWIGGAKKAREEAAKLTAEITKQRDAYIKSAGGLDILKSKAREVGATLDAIFAAKTLDAYNAAVDELNEKFNAMKDAENALTDAMDRYGISISELGPAWAQQEMDKKAAQLLQDYNVLTAAGVDHNTVISKMGPELNKYVQESIAAGTAIPEAMRPILQQMLDLGLLTDEAGNKLDNLDGLKFTESLTEGLSRAIDAINRLVAALLGIPDVHKTVYVDHVNTGGGDSGNNDGGKGEEVAMAAGFNGFVNGPTRILVGEAGREHLEVVPDDEWKSRKEGGRGGGESGPTYIIFDTTKGTPRLSDAAEVRKLRSIMGSGAVSVNARVLSRRIG